MMNRLRPSVLILLACSFTFVRTTAGAAASAPAPPLDEFTEVITYPVPGADANVTSQSTVVVPRIYRREPASGPQARRYPVVYLLHGYGGHHLRYHEKLAEAGKSLTDLADRFGAILVMPDGKPSSWYLDAVADAPDRANWQVETVITRHVIPEVDRRYRTWSERAGRGVTGMSMGGHGALYLAARHPDLFAAAASMSGVMDLRETTNPAPLAERIGAFEQHRVRWTEFSVIGQADKFVGREIGLLLDVGTEDPFIWSNRALHEKLTRLNVAHDYIERPGRHEWPYWINALPYHMQFLTDRLRPAGREDGP